MRKGLLTVLSVGFGCMFLLLFGISIACQCLSVPKLLQQSNGNVSQSYPVAVEGTPLLVRQMVCYEGPFWEDGTAASVERVAALLVENTGGEFVSRGAIVLQWEEQTLVFELYVLPPGEKVLVLEKDRQNLPETQPEMCYGWSQGEYPEYVPWIGIEEGGGTTMVVENRSSDRIPLVQICYKTRNQSSGIFLGGIAYTVEVRNLRPGERRLLTPFHYVCENSEVVRVQTDYD